MTTHHMPPEGYARPGSSSPVVFTGCIPSGGNPSLSHGWAKWHSRLMAPIESRTPDWRMGFGLQTARTGLRYRNPVIERTATSRVSKSFRGDLQLGKVAMPRGPRGEKRPADVIRRHPISAGLIAALRAG